MRMRFLLLISLDFTIVNHICRIEDKSSRNHSRNLHTRRRLVLGQALDGAVCELVYEHGECMLLVRYSCFFACMR